MQHLLSKASGGYELEGFHLAEMRGVAQHVDVHELGHIPVSEGGVLLLECVSQCSTLLSDDGSLFCCGLTLPDAPDELPVDILQGWNDA